VNPKQSMSSDYVPTNNLRQKFTDKDDDWVQLTPAQLKEYQESANPLKIRSAKLLISTCIHPKDFAKSGIPQISFDGRAASIFAEPHIAESITESLSQLEKRDNISGEVPTKARVVGIKIFAVQNGSKYLNLEGNFEGIETRKGKMYSNNNSDNYVGCHVPLLSNHTQFFKPGKELVVHQVDDVLDLKAALDLQDLTVGDLDKCLGDIHHLPLEEGDTETVPHYEVNVARGNAMHRAVAGESGERWLNKNLPSHSKRVYLAPGNPNSPVKALIPVAMINTIRSKIQEGNDLSKKLLAPVDLSNLTMSIRLTSKEGLIGNEIESHPMIKALDDVEKEQEMNRPFNITVGAVIDYIPG
jgi:hypothetical protein